MVQQHAESRLDLDAAQVQPGYLWDINTGQGVCEACRSTFQTLSMISLMHTSCVKRIFKFVRQRTTCNKILRAKYQQA